MGLIVEQQVGTGVLKVSNAAQEVLLGVGKDRIGQLHTMTYEGMLELAFGENWRNKHMQLQDGREVTLDEGRGEVAGELNEGILVLRRIRIPEVGDTRRLDRSVSHLYFRLDLKTNWPFLAVASDNMGITTGLIRPDDPEWMAQNPGWRGLDSHWLTNNVGFNKDRRVKK